jgi:hypothetical protein
VIVCEVNAKVLILKNNTLITINSNLERVVCFMNMSFEF